MQHSDVNGNPRGFLKYGCKVNYINMAFMPLFCLSLFLCGPIYTITVARKITSYLWRMIYVIRKICLPIWWRCLSKKNKFALNAGWYVSLLFCSPFNIHTHTHSPLSLFLLSPRVPVRLVFGGLGFAHISQWTNQSLFAVRVRVFSLVPPFPAQVTFGTPSQNRYVSIITYLTHRQVFFFQSHEQHTTNNNIY